MTSTIQKQTQHDAQVFDLGIEILAHGKKSEMKAKSNLMTVMMKCHAEGGENSLHTHATEDHVFVVLQGEATFHLGLEENEVVLHRYQGLMIPMGTYYRFQSTGDENLIQIRVGAATEENALMDRRNVRGEWLDPMSEEDHWVTPEPIPGRFFGQES